MISSETAEAFLADLTKNVKQDPLYAMKLIAEFYSNEPHFAALIMVFSESLDLRPELLNLVSLTLYRKMLEYQSQSDKLGEQIGSNQQERTDET